MANIEKEIKEKIAINLGDLVEGILRRNPPFHEIPLHPEACLTFVKYCEYENDLDEDFKLRILNAKIAWGRIRAKQILMGFHGKPFGELFPEHLQSIDEFWEWVRAKENIEDIIDTDPRPRPIKKTLVNKCVKETIKNRYPALKVNNKPFGSIGYSKNWGFNNKQYILVDTGSWRTTLNFEVGIGYPQFCMDVSCFFAENQSHYSDGYLSIEQVHESTNKALDLVDALMPFFLSSIENAFTEKAVQV
jgi:hypothetical protein